MAGKSYEKKTDRVRYTSLEKAVMTAAMTLGFTVERDKGQRLNRATFNLIRGEEILKAGLILNEIQLILDGIGIARGEIKKPAWLTVVPPATVENTVAA